MTSTIIRSPYPDVTIPDLSLPEFVFADAASRADKPALIDGPSGRAITYGELVGRARLVAGGLAARGFQPGEVFAIYLPNLPEYAVAFYGVLLAGGTNTTINPLYTVEELGTQLRDAGASYLLTIPPFLDKAVEAAGRSGVREVFVLGEAPGATPFAALLTSGRQPPQVRIDPHTDLATLPYSSGTTGLPKGVMLTHHNLVANLCQLQPVREVRADDIVVAVLPFFHLYGQTVLMAAALWRGATLVTMPRFDLERFLAVLQDYRVSLAFVVPPILLAMAKHPLVDRFDLSALRFVGSAAAPMSAELEQACARRLDCVVGQAYGLTETSPAVAVHPPVEARIRHGSVGQLLPNTEAKVVDLATGEALGRNRDGELCFRGPQVMAGYLNAPEATAAMVDPDGWLHSGDIGHVDDDGYVYVVDRVKELIKYKGLQVAPAELEAVLVAHPQITDAAVVRMADEAAGEVPKAFVVATTPLSAQEIIDYVAERVAPHKRVRAVEFIDQLPTSLSGKILRRVLMDQDRQPTASIAETYDQGFGVANREGAVMTTAISEDLRARRSQIVKQHIDAENRHDPDGVVASFHQPRYDIAPFGDAGQMNGPEAVRELWQGMIAGFPDLHIEPGRHLHADDAVFVEVTLSGTHQGAWIGIPATGRRGSVRVACLYEFEEDRLVCERVWFDVATILRQLGVLPS